MTSARGSSPPEPDWNPKRAIVRGWALGGLTALVLVGICCTLAWYAPLVILNFWVRGALGFIVFWTLCRAVQWGAGMAGTACTVTALLLSTGIVLCQHGVFAYHGVLTRSGQLAAGELWFHPAVLMWTNLSLVIGTAFSAWLCHDGSSIRETVVEILKIGR